VLSALVLVASLALDEGPSSKKLPAAPTPTEAPTPREPQRPSGRVRVGADVHGFVTEAVAPNPLLGLALRLDSEWDDGWLSPAVHAGFAWGSSATADVPGGGDARFTWTAITLDGCPLRWRDATFRLAPCVRFDVGSLRGVGYITHSASETSAWADVGLVGEARWVFAHPLYALIDGGVLVPITRVRYHFDNPDIPVHTAGALEGTFGVGLGAFFW
jgi:hypothetical protein